MGTEEVTGEVELELAEVVLVVEEIGTLSTFPDPPPQETIRNVPTHAKEKGDLKIFIDPLIMQFSRQAVDGCRTSDENERTCPHREHQIGAVQSTCEQWPLRPSELSSYQTSVSQEPISDRVDIASSDTPKCRQVSHACD